MQIADRDALRRAHDHALAFLDGLPERPVDAACDTDTVLARLGGPLPDAGASPAEVVEALVAAADPGLVSTAGPRFFGFVVGGTQPAALAAEWLTATWDQNAFSETLSPAAAAAEAAAGAWLLDLLGLPADASVGFVTGAQMANATCVIAARDAVLRRHGHDPGRLGLAGGPAVHIVTGAETHVTMLVAASMAGIGSEQIVRVPCDDQGRMRADLLRDALASLDGPLIVAAQAGNVNTGAFDPLPEIADLAAGSGAWLHVDGAFGLWAGAAPARRDLVRGVARADSWAVDGHKWLNVPYDCGYAIVRDRDAHRAAFTLTAAYLVGAATRDPAQWTPESSRRARGFATWAALRSLGRSGVAELVERCCALAARFAERAGAADGVEILNDVVLNQVLLRFSDSDEVTQAVIDEIQRDGTFWAGGTVWQGRTAMRISVSGWSTREADIDRSVAALLEAFARVAAIR
jgi:glutamate/tyrosine decarboxylase-like PLP-dependent enzyme